MKKQNKLDAKAAKLIRREFMSGKSAREIHADMREEISISQLYKILGNSCFYDEHYVMPELKAKASIIEVEILDFLRNSMGMTYKQISETVSGTEQFQNKHVPPSTVAASLRRFVEEHCGFERKNS